MVHSRGDYCARHRPRVVVLVKKPGRAMEKDGAGWRNPRRLRYGMVPGALDTGAPAVGATLETGVTRKASVCFESAATIA